MGAQEKTATAKPVTSRGRRRLDFKRFQGKSMFLDLPGYRHVARLEEELTSRGATLETQFHSGVKYLITMTRNEDGKHPSHSPSTPSPNTSGTAKSSISQLLSPATDHSPSEATPRQGILTRSQQMLQLSRGRGGRKADLRSLAQQWQCKVVTLDQLLAELKRLKPLPQTSGSCDRETRGKIRSLQGPFLKVEDISHVYRPLVLEMKRWPRPLCHTPHKASPFDPPHLAKTAEEKAPAGVQEVRGKEKTAVRETRPGHCECCAVKFEDLHMHLSSARHQEYACNEDNFKSLDRLIAAVKPFRQFVCELRSTPPHSTCDGVSSLPYTPPQSLSPTVSSHLDSVNLVTLPTSHTTPIRRSPRKHTPTKTSPKTHTHSKSPHTDSKAPQTDSKSPHTDSKLTPVKRKRKSQSVETTPTNNELPVFQATPTKKLRFSVSPEVVMPTKRRRRSVLSSTATPRGSSVSPASKKMKPTLSPSPCPGVRRSPRLLLKQLMSSSPADK